MPIAAPVHETLADIVATVDIHKGVELQFDARIASGQLQRLFDQQAVSLRVLFGIVRAVTHQGARRHHERARRVGQARQCLERRLQRVGARYAETQSRCHAG